MADSKTTGQLYDNGDVVVDHNNNEFEVVAVSHQADEKDNPINFVYHVQLKSEVDAAREARAKADAEAAKALAEAQAAEEERLAASKKLEETNLGEGQVPEPTGVQQNG